jgi:hypothetical protein
LLSNTGFAVAAHVVVVTQFYHTVTEQYIFVSAIVS